MDAIENLLSRNSPRELTTPIPSKEDMSDIYQAALRAPDHAWLRPSRFIQVTGKGLDKLSELYANFATKHLNDVTPLQLEKYKSAPYRAPMVIVLVTKVAEHPKVQKLSKYFQLLRLHKTSYWPCMQKTTQGYGELASWLSIKRCWSHLTSRPNTGLLVTFMWEHLQEP